MSIGELVVYLAIALLCGLGGQMLVGRSVGGYVVTTLVGLVGAVLGGWLGRSLGAPEPFPVTIGQRTIPILWTIIGAALVTVLVAWLQRRQSRR